MVEATNGKKVQLLLACPICPSKAATEAVLITTPRRPSTASSVIMPLTKSKQRVYACMHATRSVNHATQPNGSLRNGLGRSQAGKHELSRTFLLSSFIFRINLVCHPYLRSLASRSTLNEPPTLTARVVWNTSSGWAPFFGCHTRTPGQIPAPVGVVNRKVRAKRRRRREEKRREAGGIEW